MCACGCTDAHFAAANGRFPTAHPAATPTHTNTPFPPQIATVPAATPATAVVTSPTLSPTPHPLAPYTLEGLRQRSYPASPIRVRAVLAETADFTQSYFDYSSDGLTITGVMHTPAGDGPFPVVLLLHGYFERDRYWSGAGYMASRRIFCAQWVSYASSGFAQLGENPTAVSACFTRGWL